MSKKDILDHMVLSPVKTMDDKVFWGECGACDWKCQHTTHSIDQANACLERHLTSKHQLHNSQ